MIQWLLFALWVIVLGLILTTVYIQGRTIQRYRKMTADIIAARKLL